MSKSSPGPTAPEPRSQAAAAEVPAVKPARRSRPPQPLPERSREAKQRAAAILEVLAGARTPAAAAQTLGVSLTRYYGLEERALAGLVAACEPPPRGPHPDPVRRLAVLERDCQRWRQECARQQALVRAAQRTIGLAPPAPPPAKAKGQKRRRRPVVRALHAVAQLRAGEDQTSAGASPVVATES